MASDQLMQKCHATQLNINLRMGCSPYFVFTLIALLTFITMRWWSLSGQNDELERRIRGLQNEIVLE